MLAAQRERVAGALAGKTMYVIPHLVVVPDSPLVLFAAGVQLTDNCVVVMRMICVAHVGLHSFDSLVDPSFFVRSVHVTGNLDALDRGTDEDQRLFTIIADEYFIIHYGSSYGGNVLLGKIARSLHQSAYDGWKSGKLLIEQFMLLGIVDKQTGCIYHVCDGFPPVSDRTNLAMTLPPDALGKRYHVEFHGDDITWFWVGEDGRLHRMNSENGVFGVAEDTNEATNPAALSTIQDSNDVLLIDVACNERTQEVWREGRIPKPPSDLGGWFDWAGKTISECSEEDKGLA